jgi:hypothetical protein
MKLRNLSVRSHHISVLDIDGDPSSYVVLLSPDEASKVARQIQQCVNMHDPMVAVLETFSSKGMGQMLIELLIAMDTTGHPSAAEAIERMRKLINAIDVILKGLELGAYEHPDC